MPVGPWEYLALTLSEMGASGEFDQSRDTVCLCFSRIAMAVILRME